MNLLSLWGVHSGMVCGEGYQFAGLCDIQNAAYSLSAGVWTSWGLCYVGWYLNLIWMKDARCGK